MTRRRVRLLDRAVQRRDARLVLVATEGRETEPRYLEILRQKRLIDTARVRLVVLPTGEDNRSDPKAVLERVDEAAGRYGLLAMDLRWLVVDLDQWGDKKLAEVARLASQKGLNLAVSNPCFELWLRLHLPAEPPEPSPPECAAWRESVVEEIGGLSKAGLPADLIDRASVGRAVERARAMGREGDRWPQTPGSRMPALLSHLGIR